MTRGGTDEDNSRWVHMKGGGGRRMNLFTNRGSGYTIIPPEIFRPSMGKIKFFLCFFGGGFGGNPNFVPLYFTYLGFG